MINDEIVQEILHELFSSLEVLETQSAAILQFLKDKGIASEEELAVHFEQAGNASSVRWRAARVRIDHLVSAAIKTAEHEAPKSEQPKFSESKQKPVAKTTRGTSGEKEMPSSKGEPEKEPEATEKVAASGKSETKQAQQVNSTAANNGNQESDRNSKNPEHLANSDSSEDAPKRKTA